MNHPSNKCNCNPKPLPDKTGHEVHQDDCSLWDRPEQNICAVCKEEVKLGTTFWNLKVHPNCGYPIKYSDSQEPHPTIDNFCCACEADQAFMNEKIAEARRRIQELITLARESGKRELMMSEGFKQIIQTERIETIQEIRDWAEKNKKELKTKNESDTCNPFCHDSGKESALTDLINFLTEK